MRPFLAIVCTAALGCLLDACNSDSQSTASPSPARLSPDQAAFESFVLRDNGGVHDITASWDNPIVPSNDFILSQDLAIGLSPLQAGPQIEEFQLTNLTSSLSLPSYLYPAMLVNGNIIITPANVQYVSVSYLGTGVEYSALAADRETVLYRYWLHDLAVVPASGTLAGAPPELDSWFGGLLSSTALAPGASFAEGAAYIRYQATTIGDALAPENCTPSASADSVMPCATDKSLDDIFPVTSNIDGVTYQLSDGTEATLQGATVWTSNKPMSSPIGASQAYVAYFELDGNVYTGTLVRDGTDLAYGLIVDGQTKRSATNYGLLFNQAFVDSLRTAIPF